MTQIKDLCRETDIVYEKVQKMSLDIFATNPESFGYDYPALCCIDAVLSINRQYKKFVLPRVSHFQTKYPNIRSLSDLLNFINSISIERFAEEVLHYRDYNRIKILRNLIERLLDIVGTNNHNDEMRRLRTWAISQGICGYKALNVKGINLATYQYLRMLLGVDTIKPDTHIQRFLEKILEKKLKREECIILLEKVALKMNIPSISLDHAIWKFQSE